MAPLPEPEKRMPQRLKTASRLFEHATTNKLFLGAVAVIGVIGFALSVAGFVIDRQENQATSEAISQSEDAIIEKLVSDAPPFPKRDFLIGTWEHRTLENGRVSHMIWTINDDGTSSYTSTLDGQAAYTPPSTWSYAEGLFYEAFPAAPHAPDGSYHAVFEQPFKGRAVIRKLDDASFELTIVDNDAPEYRGIKRVYRRMEAAKK